MNIVFFTRYFHPHVGGVEKHVFSLSQELIKRRHKIIVVTEKYDTGLKDAELYNGIKIIRIPHSSSEKLKKFAIWFWLFRHAEILRGADIVHCHDVFYWYLPFRFIFPFKKVCTTFHGYEGNAVPSKKAIIMHKIAEIFSFGNICVGDFLKKWYGTKPSIITYGAIGKLSRTISTAVQADHAVFIGRLEEETGIMEYLKAMDLLKKKRKKIRLLVLGDGSQRETAEKYARAHKLSVEFCGFVTNIYRYAKPADIVFTSRYLGILEAFSMRKFVIAHYNNRIKKDYLSMAPFKDNIVIAGNATQIAESILHLDQSRRSEMIESSYAWVKKQTWRKLATQYENLWDDDSIKRVSSSV